MADNPTTNGADPAAFIARWSKAEGSERANYQLFLSELCELIGVERPQPAGKDASKNAYVFERSVEVSNRDGTTSTNFLDLYKRGSFVLEAKQGVEKQDADDPIAQKRKLKKGHGVRGSKVWDTTMTRAKAQAERYAHALPNDEPSPPFLMVADVGHVIEVYSDFSQMGRQYLPFPDPGSFRIQLKDLAEESARERLRKIWEDPWSLDPTRHSARVTREVADRLAKLAKSFEKDGHSPQRVAEFLMRCLFTMFAEDVGLIPENGFTRLLEKYRDKPDVLPKMLSHLWQTMNTGGFSPILEADLLRFNGGLYLHQEALPLTRDQLELLIDAARADWKDVEPAIFGTLLERALDPIERHKLGAHYTPRAYVERLVMPTIIEPLRADWDGVKTAAIRYLEEGEQKKAAEAVRAYHRKLCSTRVLDPACGSGNFLYVTLEHMKRLEGEVDDFLHNELGEQAGLGLWGTAHQRTGRGEKLKKGEHFTVDPHQFLGIEVNPRAATIAEMVLWIGYLQWHYRAFGIENLPEPVLRDFHNVECRDAVLAWDSMEEEKGEDGKPLTRWDGRTYKKHPVTGEDVPDETARVQVYRYINPRKAEWPAADFVVGNPPFVGNKRMRLALGDGYVETLRSVYPEVPGSADYVMYWWAVAAALVRSASLRRFGLITTNSITQTYNRRIVESAMKAATPLKLLFAVPDHPWVDSADGANVRIAMTVGAVSDAPGLLLESTEETRAENGELEVEFRRRRGTILADLKVGADVASAQELKANQSLSFQGPIPVGEGFRLVPEELQEYGLNAGNLPPVVHRYCIGRDIMQQPVEKYIIDFFGLSLDEARKRYPALLQKVIRDVKPHRDANKDTAFRENWWLWGRPRPEMRDAISGLDKFIATCRTAKHRVFTLLGAQTMPDAKLIAFGLGDAYYLGVLSSSVHVRWATRSGAWLGVGNDTNYNHSECFAKFPFPDPPGAIKQRIRELGEQLDAHRKARQAEHPELTMTGMYNVLEKLRAGEKLSAKEKTIHEQGLVSVLKQIHDDLDAAVFEAYGWSADLSDEEILEKLVALNHERAEEEAGGLVRWLRPEFQNPTGKQGAAQGELVKEKKKKAAVAPKEKQDWPAALPEQAQAIAGVLATAEAPLDAGALAKHFKRGNKKRVEELLATLAEMGRAREVGEGRYVA